LVQVWFSPEKLPGARCGDGKACRVKIWQSAAGILYEQAATLWWSFPGAAKKKKNKAASGEENWEYEMTFTGTLIEDLMATVERAEQRAQPDRASFVEPLLVEASVVEPMFVETWLASVQENADYDAKLLGVA
jgi:hypothetical protein